MSKPIRHHIVPQCYLQNFTNSVGKLHVLPKDKSRSTFDANTNNVAVRKHYYSIELESGEIDTRIESVLSDLEGIAKPILNAIQSEDPISIQQKEDLSVFIGIMYSRNPNFRDGVEKYLKQSMERIKTQILMSPSTSKDIIDSAPKEVIVLAGGKGKVCEWLNDSLEVILSPNASLEYIKLGVEITRLLVNMRWRLLVNHDQKLPFITSDNPCYVVNKDIEKSPYGVGIGLAGSRLYFPISPQILLVADSNKNVIEYKHVKDSTQVARINSRTTRHAEAEVYTSVLNEKILQLHNRNRNYAFATLIDHVGPYQLVRRKLMKIG